MANLVPVINKLAQAIEHIVQISNTASASSAALGNGDSATFTMTTSSNSGGVLNGEPDITLYLGSVGASTAFPDGASIDMSQWQIMGPYTDWGAAASNGSNIKSKVFIRNVSAGAGKTIVFRGWNRTIINSFYNLGGS